MNIPSSLKENTFPNKIMEYSNNRSANVWHTEPSGNNVQFYSHASAPIAVNDGAMQIVKGKALCMRAKGSTETEPLSAYEPPSPNIFLSEYSLLQYENNVVIPPPFDKSLCQTRRTARYFIKPSTPAGSLQSYSDIRNDKSDSSKRQLDEYQKGNQNEMKRLNSGILNNNVDEDIEKITSRLRSLSLGRKKKQTKRKKDEQVAKSKKKKNRDLASTSTGDVEIEKNNSSSDFHHPSSKKARPRTSKFRTRVKCVINPGVLPQSETEMAQFSKLSITTLEKKKRIESHLDSSGVSKKYVAENRKTRNKTDGAATKSLPKIQSKTGRLTETLTTKAQQKAEDVSKSPSPPPLLSPGNISSMTKGKRRALSKKPNRGTAHMERSSVVLKPSATAGKSKIFSLRKPLKRREDIPVSALRQRKLLKAPDKNEDIENQNIPSNLQSNLEEIQKNNTKRCVSLPSPKYYMKKSFPISSPREHPEGEKARKSPEAIHGKRFSETNSKKDALQNTSKKARLTHSHKRMSPVRKSKEETSSTNPSLKMSPKTANKKSSDKTSADIKKASIVSNDAKTTSAENVPLKNPEKATPISFDSKAAPTSRNKKAGQLSSEKKETSLAKSGTASTSDENKSAANTDREKAEPPKSDKKETSQTNDGTASSSNEKKSTPETGCKKAEPPKSDKKETSQLKLVIIRLSSPKRTQMGTSQTDDGTNYTHNEIKSTGDTSNIKAEPPRSDKKETSQTDDGTNYTSDEIKSAGDTSTKETELPQNDKKAVHQTSEGKSNLETKKKADTPHNQETKASFPVAIRTKKAQDTTNVKKTQPKTLKMSRTTSYNEKLRPREASPKMMPKTKMASVSSQISPKKISPRINTWRTRPHTNRGDDGLSGWKPRESNVPEKRSHKTEPYLRKKRNSIPSARKHKPFIKRKTEIVNNVYWEYPSLGNSRLPLHKRKINHRKRPSGQAKQTRKRRRLRKPVSKLRPLRRLSAESENFKLADAFLRGDSEYELYASNMPYTDGTPQHTSAFQQYIRWTREGGGGMSSQEKADLGTAQGIIEDNEICFIPQYDASHRQSESEEDGEKQVFGKYYCQQQAMFWTRQGSLSTDTDLSRKSSLIYPHAQEIFSAAAKRNRAHGLPMKTRDHFRILPGSPSKSKAPMNPDEHTEGSYLHRSSSPMSSCQCLTTRSSGISRARSAFIHYPRDDDRMYKHYDILEKPSEVRQKNRVNLTQSAELHSESVEFYKYSKLEEAKMQNVLSSEPSCAGKDSIFTGDPVQMIRYSEQVGVTPYPSMEDFNQDQLFEVAQQAKQKNIRRCRGVYEYDYQGHRTEKLVMLPRRHEQTSGFRRRIRGRTKRKTGLPEDLNIFSKKLGFPSPYSRSIPRSRSVSSRRHSSPGTVCSENSRDACDVCHSDSDEGWEDVESIPLISRGSIEDVKFEGHGADLFNLLPQPLRYEENLRLLAALKKQNELIKIGKIRRASRPSVTDASTLCDLGSEFRHLSMPRLSPSVIREKRWLRQRLARSPTVV